MKRFLIAGLASLALICATPSMASACHELGGTSMSTMENLVLGNLNWFDAADNDWKAEWNSLISRGWSPYAASWSTVAWNNCNDKSQWIWITTAKGYSIYVRFTARYTTTNLYHDWKAEEKLP